MAAVDGLETALTKKAEASSLQYFAVKDGSNITETENWKNKLGVNLLDSLKANKNASGLSVQNIEAWKNTLGVGEIPENMATNDGEDDDGNPVSGTSYTKEQSNIKYYPKVSSQYFNSNYVLLADGTPKAADDLGKNIANTSLTSVAGAGMTLGAAYTWNTAGQAFSITGLTNRVNESSFTDLLVRNSSGQLGYAGLTQLFMKLPDYMNVTQRNDWISKMNTDVANTYLQLVTVIDGNFINGTTDFVITIYGLNINKLQGLDQVTMELVGPDGNPVPDTAFDVTSYSVNSNSELAVSFHFESSYTFMTGEYTLKVIRKLVILGEVSIMAYNSFSEQAIPNNEMVLTNNGMSAATYTSGTFSVTGEGGGTSASLVSANPLPVSSDYDIAFSISAVFVGASSGASWMNRLISCTAGLSFDGTTVHVGAGGTASGQGLGFIDGSALRIMAGATNTVGYTVNSYSGEQKSVTLQVSIQKRGSRYKLILYKSSDNSLLYAGTFNNTTGNPMKLVISFAKDGYPAGLTTAATQIRKRNYI